MVLAHPGALPRLGVLRRREVLGEFKDCKTWFIRKITGI